MEDIKLLAVILVATCAHLQTLLFVLLAKMVSSIMPVLVQNVMQSVEPVLLPVLIHVLHATQTPSYHQTHVSLALVHALLV